MFAVITTGGKQYRVAAGETLEVEKLPGEAGDSLLFDQVLMVAGNGNSDLGAPFVSGASVAAEIVEQKRGPKIIVFKKRRRKNSRRKNGHRQSLTVVRITDILTDGKKPAAKKSAAKGKDKAETGAKEKREATKPAAGRAKAEPKTRVAANKSEAKSAETLFKPPAGKPDDLKQISGVGPVLEKKLNALGISKYEQIAAFTAEEIKKVDDALSFKGRIERDDWVGQASKLAKDKEG